MASAQDTEPNPGISSHEFFESIGRKAEAVAAANGSSGNADALAADDESGKVVDEISSLCMSCHATGMTRLLLTKIPYFREVVLMSFSCDECGFANSEVQAAGSIQPLGTTYELRCREMADLGRQVVKADSATVKFVELDVEIPPGRGKLTTIEGLLTGVLDDLELGQEERKAAGQEDVWKKIDEIVARGREMLAGNAFPFRVQVDDPAGNSWIAPDPRDAAGKWEKRTYKRTAEQNAALGLADTSDVHPLQAGGMLGDEEIVPDQVYDFPATCPGCMHPCTTHMKMVDIPHFKQVVLMSTVCDACGYRSNDVKTGGAVPEKGRRITLRVNSQEDLARDILKSETCALECPDLGLSVNPGTLGGRFTTVEGLLTQVRDDLKGQIFETGGLSGGFGASQVAVKSVGNATGAGDSLAPEEGERWTSFFAAVDDAVSGRRPFTVVLTDPLANSYVQSLADEPGVNDEKITVEDYDRTDEEEEELGLRDMKVEGYEEDATKDAVDDGGTQSQS